MPDILILIHGNRFLMNKIKNQIIISKKSCSDQKEFSFHLSQVLFCQLFVVVDVII